MNNLLVICGPTATGKTLLALKLAKIFNAEIVSADSRQVFRGMDIGTGKDLPAKSKLQNPNDKSEKGDFGYYVVNEVRIWGYDLVDPREEFSASQYINAANEIIKNIQKRGKLPILVGGTGFYIKGVIDGIETSDVPQNKRLRESLMNKNSDELIKILGRTDPFKLESMNLSDRKNPRRLIRAIEVGEFKTKYGILPKKRIVDINKVLMVGLIAAKDFLGVNIEERVRDRIKKGLEGEIRTLLKKGIGWNLQSMNTLGYKEWREYFEAKRTRDQVIDKWTQNEKKYAKRQITWFRKEKRIYWFDISLFGWMGKVEKLVEKWNNE